MFLHRHSFSSYFFAVAVLLLGTFSARAELSVTSPFLPPQTQAITAATAPTPLELRGVTAIGGTTMFSIYDPIKKVGTWVKLNESGNPFAVRDYDPDKDAVTIDYQGRTLNVTMRSPKIAVAAAPLVPNPSPLTVPIVPSGLPIRTATNVLPVPNPTPTAEAAKLADWTNEIQKRRDARNQVGGTVSPPAPISIPAQVRPLPGPQNSVGPQPIRSAP